MASRDIVVRIEEGLLEAISRSAEEQGVAPDDVIALAVRRYFGSRGLGLLAELAEQGPDGMSEAEAIAAARREVRAHRANVKH